MAVESVPHRPTPFAARTPFEHDVIVVGGRVAGASTALLLARRGLRVLVLERAPAPGTDTLSTHALTRGGVLQLRRWGLLDRLRSAGTPPVRRAAFRYGDETELVEIGERAGVDALYAPRRTVLDPLLVTAAEEAGAEVRFGTAVDGLLRDGGRVVGVTARGRDGVRGEHRAPLVIGADGHRSLVARAAGARDTWRGSACGAFVYGYWPRGAARGYEWFYRPGATAGVIPTDGDQVCVWVGTRSGRFLADFRRNPARAFDLLLPEAAPEVAGLYPGHRRAGRLHGFAGVPGYLRQPWGPGWALVGDAGAFRDPLSAHGMTDALRDAELLAIAATEALSGAGDPALAAYGERRDEIALPLARLTDTIATYTWTLPEVRKHLIALSKLMAEEVELLESLDHTSSERAVA